MKTKNRKIMLLLICGGLAGAAPGVEAAAAEDPAHNELRTLRMELIGAITKGDLDAVLRHVHTNVVVTWQNNELCRGHPGLRDFFQRTGKEAFKGYRVPPTPDELTILHGADTGVSFGSTVAQYKLLGKDYELKSRWTATVVKEDGRWLLASYHISMNVLNNPLLDGAKQALYWAGAGALAVGLLAGFLLGKRKRI
jgi:ketosteroid isomerase-like protein